MAWLLLFLWSTVLSQPFPSEVPQPQIEDLRGSEDLSAEAETARQTQKWEDHMKDFVPGDMVTFEVKSRSAEEFFEVIDEVPSKVQGAFFVSSKETKDVDLLIYGPAKTVVYEARKKKEDLFDFEATVKGLYVFLFTNHKFVEQVQVTLALHTGNSTDQLLDKEHLSPVESGLLEVQKAVKDFQMDQQFAQLRQESHYKTVQSANTSVFWFSLLECMGVIGVTSWQVYYVKKILDHRRMI